MKGPIRNLLLQAFTGVVLLSMLWLKPAMPAAAGSDDPAPVKPLRVLFIGNSLTYANDLPSIVEALARAEQQRPLVYKSVAIGGFSLEDHWNQGEASAAIAEGGWDIVALQQGPSALPESRVLLLDYTRRFAQQIRGVGGRPALYMVWPSIDRIQDFDGVSASYRLAAKEVDGVLFPAGEAWRAAWRRDPALQLYSPDGLHPTVTGSYLAALVIYEQMYARRPAGLVTQLRLLAGNVIEFSSVQAGILQAAAAEANEKFGKRAVS